MGESGELFSSSGAHVSLLHEARVVDFDRGYTEQAWVHGTGQLSTCLFDRRVVRGFHVRRLGGLRQSTDP